jgi:hypothetical protein
MGAIDSARSCHFLSFSLPNATTQQLRHSRGGISAIHSNFRDAEGATSRTLWRPEPQTSQCDG